MRLSEVLGKAVIAPDGSRVGKVRDARIVQDGPPLSSGLASLRLHGLLVGSGAMADRLGYGRTGTRGPWLLRVLLQRRRGPLYVPWHRVVAVEPDAVRIECRADDLEPAPPLHEVRPGGGP